MSPQLRADSQVAVLRRRIHLRRLVELAQRYRRYSEHTVYDRLVGYLHLKGQKGYAVARYDMVLHHSIRHLEL